MVIALSQNFHFFLFGLYFQFEILIPRSFIMPLPIGHSAIGFATHSLISNDRANFNKWHMAIFIIVLSNLPDIDVLFGLVLHNNGSAFHRGPTHSILFALIMGYLASKSSKICSYIPKASFKTCFMLILSHVVADYFLTSSPVSFCWPFAVSFSTGNSGWSHVFHTVFFDADQDTGILLVCTFIIILVLIFKRLHIFRRMKPSAFTFVRGQALEESKYRSEDKNYF